MDELLTIAVFFMLLSGMAAVSVCAYWGLFRTEVYQDDVSFKIFKIAVIVIAICILISVATMSFQMLKTAFT